MTTPTLLATQFFDGTGDDAIYNLSFAGVRPGAGGILPYLAEADVKAEYRVPATAITSAEVVPLTVEFIGPLQVRLSPIPPVGVGNIKIYRKTNGTYPEVDFLNNIAVQEADLDLDSRQMLFLAQEAADRAALAGSGVDALREQLESGDYGVTGDDIAAAVDAHAAQADPHPGYVRESAVAQPLGVASLDADGKVPASQLPPTQGGGLTYEGPWDASGDTLPSASTSGQFWIVSVPGTITISDTPTACAIGDWLIYDGAAWERIPNSAGPFIGLADVPGSYAGAGNRLLAIKPDASGIEFINGAGGLLGAFSGAYAHLPVASNTLIVRASEVIVADYAGNSWRLTDFNEVVNATATGIGGALSLPNDDGAAVYAIYNPATGARGIVVVAAAVSSGPRIDGTVLGAWGMNDYASCLISLWRFETGAGFQPGLQIGRHVDFSPVFGGSGAWYTAYTVKALPHVPVGAVRMNGYVGTYNLGADLGIRVACNTTGFGEQQLYIRGIATSTPAAASALWDVPLLEGARQLYARTSNTITSISWYVTGYDF